jgi:meso-butanediol dehydrogenase/(S,S)-butanediol dehydrogenase/diacetyl reductase
MALLKDKLAVVTGGRGLGAAMAKGFAIEGAQVIVVDIDGEAAKATADEINRAGGKAWGEALDISDRTAVMSFASRIIEKHGSIQVLVNNAGIAPRVGLNDANLAEMWDKVIDVNLHGQFNMTLAFIPALKIKGGSIIYTASISGFIAPRSSAAYGAAKAGLTSLTKYMARELAPFNIRVNALAPGVMVTDMTSKTRDTPQGSKHMDRVPMNRNGEAREMAGPAIFLASDMSSYVTGVTIPVDGGFLAV